MTFRTYKMILWYLQPEKSFFLWMLREKIVHVWVILISLTDQWNITFEQLKSVFSSHIDIVTVLVKVTTNDAVALVRRPGRGIRLLSFIH